MHIIYRYKVWYYHSERVIGVLWVRGDGGVVEVPEGLPDGWDLVPAQPGVGG